ncbi:Rv3212 family protein [Corynebacterium sp. H78]|uniref:Rv3212 family protein n=1 Tax=Corynebacterium sp. H78 TaxID=3133417 RepID=UPI0030AC2004
MPFSEKFRANRKHYIASAVLILVSVMILSWTWWKAPVRQVQHQASQWARPAVAATDVVPSSFEEAWRFAGDGDEASAPIIPLVVEGVAVISDANGVTAVDTQDGTIAWSYHRDLPLCTAMVSNGRVVAVFEGEAGCGEATSIVAETGEYHATRRSMIDGAVAPVRSNDNTGIISKDYVEIWRGDLVNNLEYGKIPASSEPDVQPHPGCTIADAMVRKNNTVIVNNCPDGHRLVFQSTDPEESQEPEIGADVPLAGPARLAVVGQKGAVVRIGDELITYDLAGKETSRTHAAATQPASAFVAPSAASTADLPHHMTWFSGTDVLAFRPNSLELAFTVPHAIGTPAAVGDRVLVPVHEGIAVVDPTNGAVERTIPVHRDGTAGPIVLAVSGDILVEKRGNQLFGLRMVADAAPIENAAPIEETAAGDVPAAVVPTEEAVPQF